MQKIIKIIAKKDKKKKFRILKDPLVEVKVTITTAKGKTKVFVISPITVRHRTQKIRTEINLPFLRKGRTLKAKKKKEKPAGYLRS